MQNISTKQSYSWFFNDKRSNSPGKHFNQQSHWQHINPTFCRNAGSSNLPTKIWRGSL